MKVAVSGGCLKVGDRFTIEFKHQVYARVQAVWVWDDYAGAQFDQPLSAIAGKYAA